MANVIRVGYDDNPAADNYGVHRRQSNHHQSPGHVRYKENGGGGREGYNEAPPRWSPMVNVQHPHQQGVGGGGQREWGMQQQQPVDGTHLAPNQQYFNNAAGAPLQQKQPPPHSGDKRSVSAHGARRGSRAPHEIESKMSQVSWNVDAYGQTVAQLEDFEDLEDEGPPNPANPFYWVEQVQNVIIDCWDARRRIFIGLVVLALLIISHVHLIWALKIDSHRKGVVNLLIIFIFGWAVFLWAKVVVPGAERSGLTAILGKHVRRTQQFLRDHVIVKIGAYLLVVAIIALLLAWDIVRTQEYERLSGLLGMFSMLVIAALISIKPTRIIWHTVFMGMFLQVVFAIIVLRWDFGKDKFVEFIDIYIKYLWFFKNGSDFTYSFISTPLAICGMKPAIAFEYIQVLVLMGSTISVLYYYEVLQTVLKQMAVFVQVTMGTTATESFTACSTVIIGQGESTMLIRPYLNKMTASELHAILTTGFACIAGVVFALFISFGACPSYLISGAVMAGPASLAVSKLVYPETQKSHCVSVQDLELPPAEEKSAMEAVVVGCEMGAQIIISVVGNLVCFVAIMACFDFLVGYWLDLIGFPGWNLQLVLGYLLYPFAYVIGVTESKEQTLAVAQLIGVKLAVNDLIAYIRLGEFVNAGRLTKRSAMIATYACCSWSNVVGAGTQAAFLNKLAPRRRALINKIIWRAMIAGNISCFLSSSLAGIMISNPTICKPNFVNVADCFNLTQGIEFFNVITGNHSYLASNANVSETNFPLLTPLIGAAINGTRGRLGGEL